MASDVSRQMTTSQLEAALAEQQRELLPGEFDSRFFERLGGSMNLGSVFVLLL